METTHLTPALDSYGPSTQPPQWAWKTINQTKPAAYSKAPTSLPIAKEAPVLLRQHSPHGPSWPGLCGWRVTISGPLCIGWPWRSLLLLLRHASSPASVASPRRRPAASLASERSQSLGTASGPALGRGQSGKGRGQDDLSPWAAHLAWRGKADRHGAAGARCAAEPHAGQTPRDCNGCCSAISLNDSQ